LLLKSGQRSGDLARCQHFHGGFQSWVLLAHNLIEFSRPHSGFLQLLERTARFDSLMLADIADQKHAVIIRTNPFEEIAHLVGAGKARLIDEVEVFLLMGDRIRAAGEETLQGCGVDSCLIQLARGERGRGEALDLITVRFSSAANGRKRGRLARAGITLDSLDLVRRAENIFDYGLLCVIQVRVLVGNGDSLRPRKNRLDLVLSRTHPTEFMFRFDGLGSSELTARNTLRPFDDLKFAGGQAYFKIGADLTMSDLAHAATKAVADQCAFVHNRLTFEVLVTGKGERLSNSLKRVDRFLVLLRTFPSCADNSVGLVSEVCCQLPMRCRYLTWRVNLFAIPRRVRRDLGGFLPRTSRALKVITNLLAAGTGCIEVFLCISLDLWGTAPPGRNFVTELA
jgi:hypothetical protein